MDYSSFLQSKRILAPAVGVEVDPASVNGMLYPFQREIVAWALRRGRAAIFADCGLGKTPMQVEWARVVSEHTGMPVIIFAPLAVAQQTAREGAKFGVSVTICRTQGDVRGGVNVANYEMLEHFTADAFGGLVLDESSILKSYSGVMRQAISDFGRSIPFRLACTATPAPNDLIELVNHAEFLDVMKGKEIIALFFTQDGNTTHSWRLKGHAKQDFWRWMATWCVAARKPSDLGHDDGAFVLPPLRMHQLTVEQTAAPDDALFPLDAATLQERQAARRASLPDRVKAAADLVNASDEPWIVWCNLNAEGDALEKAIPGSVQVSGSDSSDFKTAAMLDFAEGRTRVLISKPSICGFGMNWQHCRNMAFVGLSDSYEQLYQAIRRCWRFGQTRTVHCHVITAHTEGAVVRNIERKERQAQEMMESITEHMKELSLGKAERDEMDYQTDVARGKNYTLYLGDCVERLKEVETESIGLSIFSPPFPGMYAYTNSARDMGNTRNHQEMLEQFRYLVSADNLLRVVKPGRNCCVHLTQSPAFKWCDGYIGLKDFRGDIIRLMEGEGWTYYGEVCIDKDPQVKAARTNDMTLQFKTLCTDSSHCRPALADYLLIFKKPGQNAEPVPSGTSKRIPNPNAWITSDQWIQWARPVWSDIRETDVLNVAQARETDDERHLCPLQLGVIERAVKLWTNPGDTVLSPFAGIGSEGYESLRLGRKFIGIELKESYWRSARRNLDTVDGGPATSLLDLMEDERELAETA